MEISLTVAPNRVAIWSVFCAARLISSSWCANFPVATAAKIASGAMTDNPAPSPIAAAVPPAIAPAATDVPAAYAEIAPMADPKATRTAATLTARLTNPKPVVALSPAAVMSV